MSFLPPVRLASIFLSSKSFSNKGKIKVVQVRKQASSSSRKSATSKMISTAKIDCQDFI